MACNGCIHVGPSVSSTAHSNAASSGISDICPPFGLFPQQILSSVLTQLTSSFPGGGMGTSRNRTRWPVNGGAIAIQPGWFQGHATAFFYINLGFGTNGPDNGPPNMSFPMVPVFQITGPSKGPYPGTFCLPQVPLPANTTVNVGDNATIQIVETAVHGAALFNVSSKPRFRTLRANQ